LLYNTHNCCWKTKRPHLQCFWQIYMFTRIIHGSLQLLIAEIHLLLR
jgi:hypothetical protein